MSWALVDPRDPANKGDSTLCYKPSKKSMDDLKALSKVWKARPAWLCKVCGGKGHIEAECATKRTLDRYAKTCDKEQRIIWG